MIDRRLWVGFWQCWTLYVSPFPRWIRAWHAEHWRLRHFVALSCNRGYSSDVEILIWRSPDVFKSIACPDYSHLADNRWQNRANRFNCCRPAGSAANQTFLQTLWLLLWQLRWSSCRAVSNFNIVWNSCLVSAEVAPIVENKSLLLHWSWMLLIEMTRPSRLVRVGHKQTLLSPYCLQSNRASLRNQLTFRSSLRAMTRPSKLVWMTNMWKFYSF